MNESSIKHQANVELAEKLGSTVWYDSYTGTWSGNADHIDLEAWTAEWTVDEFGHKCSKCGEYLPDGEDVRKPQFCPECGRAMTPEAWAMLEKRLRG